MLQIRSFHVGGVTHDEFDSNEEGQLQLVVLKWTRKKRTYRVMSRFISLEHLKIFESCGQILFSRAQRQKFVAIGDQPEFSLVRD